MIWEWARETKRWEGLPLPSWKESSPGALRW